MIKEMTCPHCGMPVQVRPPWLYPGYWGGNQFTCKACLHKCALNPGVRLAMGALSLAAIGVSVALLILVVNTCTQLIAAHQQVAFALLIAAALVIFAGAQALSNVICCKYGSLVKPGLL